MIKRFALMIFAGHFFLNSFTPIAASQTIQQEHDVVRLATYTNEHLQYAIDYPADWTDANIPSSKLDLFLFAPCHNDPSHMANMNIYAEEMPEPVTLEETYAEVIAYFSTHFENVNTGETHLNGIPSKWILHTQVKNGLEMQVLQYLVVAQETKYVILSFGAVSADFPHFQPVFEKIAASLRFLNNGSF